MNGGRRVLVTGGTGFLGAALVARLLDQGRTVRVLDNNSRGALRRLAAREGQFEMVEGDIRDPAAVRRAMAGMDRCCHLAYVNGTEFFYSMPDVVLDVAVKGMVNVIDACRAEGVRDLVLVSSSEVYQTPPVVPTPETVPLVVPDPLNPRYSYGGGKILCELMAINYGRAHFDRVVIVRPHNIYGPDMGWEHVLPQFVLRMKALCARTPGTAPIRFPIQGDGSETRAFCFVDDFTDGLMRVIEAGEPLGIYHVGTDEEVPIRDVARAVAGFYGRTIELEPGTLQKGGTPRRCPDIGKVAALGYQPRVSLADGLPVLARWYDTHAELAPGGA